MKAYKLTDSDNQTCNNTQWGPNVTHTATGSWHQLCSDGWIHFYTDPLLAVLLNPVHAQFSQPKLWECITEGKHLHETLKSGCKTLTTVRQIPLPEITTSQKKAFCLLCAKEICKDTAWNEWADNWLNNVDRTTEYAYYLYDLAARRATEAIGAENEILDRYVASLALFVAEHDKRIGFIALTNKALTYT